MHPRAARVVAGLSAAFWAIPFFGLADLLVIVVNDPDWKSSYLLELGWGVLFTLLVSVPLAVAAVRGVTGVVVAQVAAVAVAVAVAALVAGYPRQLVPALMLALDAGVLAGLAGIRRRLRIRLDPWPRVVVGIGALGGGYYAALLLHDFPATNPDITWGLDHQPMQVALGIAMITVGAVATSSLDVQGWRIPVWTLGAAVAAVGAASVAYPGLSGSAGTALGWAAGAWAVAFVGVCELRARRTAPDAGDAPAAPAADERDSARS